MSLFRFAIVATIAGCSLLACAVDTEDSASSASEIVGSSCKVVTAPKIKHCPAVYDPVCGCDGKTYGNACEASGVVSSTTPGECEGAGAGGACKLETPPPNTFCPTVYDPVCGCDGKTYSNACSAKRVVKTYTAGACGNGNGNGTCAKSAKQDVYCLDMYTPVCGCDGKTYSNACYASAAVSSWTAGECGANQ